MAASCAEDLDRIWEEHPFIRRHIGPDPSAIRSMLATLGVSSLEELIAATVPEAIRFHGALDLPAPLDEAAATDALARLAAGNQTLRSLIGQGYYGTETPPVIRRGILENPGWYTAYTPYQAEISQGRLEALLNFQTLVCDLTGMQIANASLLDEATAAAEAIAMAKAGTRNSAALTVLVSAGCHPQTLEVVRTRTEPLGLRIQVVEEAKMTPDEATLAILLQSPATDGRITDLEPLITRAHAVGALSIVACDPLAATLFKPPGEMGADIVIGSLQRFGVPMGFGGPHPAFLATRDALKRHLPGRLVGISKDASGRTAYRLSLQTREQHIRREKATSNICTAQVLLAVIASMYAVYHGPNGLRRIARRIRSLAARFAASLPQEWRDEEPSLFFDTVVVRTGEQTDPLMRKALESGYNLRKLSNERIAISFDESCGEKDLSALAGIFGIAAVPGEDPSTTNPDPALDRSSPFLEHPVFNRYHTETEMLRYLKRLESKDLSLTGSMIPLGSCTMKLNAAAEMYPISWPGFASLHPLVPADQAAGYAELAADLERWIAEITGFNAVSLQPNAGSQGEYAGLLAIRAWHASQGQSHRDICLIPNSAHGTNPASAAMVGFKVVPVRCQNNGDIDLDDLVLQAETHRDRLAAAMVTYPSTHGVFEAGVREVCGVVHAYGGQVYMDGANLNAQVGLCRPGEIGADVCHLNLHKTFCIPHGGGGPGVGPIAVAAHLAPFLPSPKGETGAVAAAPLGSASILPISWMYIRLMGPLGLKMATQIAILNANYIARRLADSFPVLYRGANGWVAHECILDLRAFKTVTAEDVAKRLMDYGFHAPTLSWPVAGTLMVEPTESESKAEIDRFCDAMIAIHAEMSEVESGAIDISNNPLKNAPHTAGAVTGDVWDRPYSRQRAAFPSPSAREFKFWPAVGRIDNVFGDRNPFCTCPPVGDQ